MPIIVTPPLPTGRRLQLITVGSPLGHMTGARTIPTACRSDTAPNAPFIPVEDCRTVLDTLGIFGQALGLAFRVSGNPARGCRLDGCALVYSRRGASKLKL